MELRYIFPKVIGVISKIFWGLLAFFIVFNLVMFNFNYLKLYGISQMIKTDVKNNGFLPKKQLKNIEDYIKMTYPFDTDDYDVLTTPIVGMGAIVKNVRIIEMKDNGTTPVRITETTTEVNKRVNFGAIKTVGIQFTYTWITPLNFFDYIEPQQNFDSSIMKVGGVNTSSADEFFGWDGDEYRNKLKEQFDDERFKTTMEIVDVCSTSKYYPDMARTTG